MPPLHQSRMRADLPVLDEAPMKYVTLAGLVLALAIINKSFADRDEQIRLDAEKNAAEQRAALYAGIIASCLNGGEIRVGDSVEADCKPRRPKLGGGS